MLKRSDYTDPDRPPSLGKPQTKLETPNIFDLVVIEDVPISPEKYKPLPYGSPHPDYANNGLVLVYQGPVRAANNQVQVRRVYASKDAAPENWFNYGVHYSGDATTNPVYVRSYIQLRSEYAPDQTGVATLGAIVTLRVTAPGTGYTAPVVTITGGGGSGATAKAILAPLDPSNPGAGAAIIGFQLLTEGTGYTSNPTVGITDPTGTGATAVAVIQPPGAVLVKEELAKIDSQEMNSLFVRVNKIYEVLPGPWLPYSRWDDELGPVQGLRRAILFADPPQTATSDVGTKTTYEAREGSSIVAMEQIETWGRDPYQKRFDIEISDPTPEKFRADVPTTTASQIEPGRPAMPVLATGELKRSSDEVNKFWRRESVTRRDPPSYPRELADYELGGINTHGSEFGGTLEIKHRLDNKPQNVEEGFDIIASKVEALGHGLTWRRTTRLFAGGLGLGPFIELLTGGDSYVDDPAVIFGAGTGDAGSGAAGTASITETPIAISDVDSGGVFTQTFASNGDDNGVFSFIGKRYNSGTWRNPAVAGNIAITAKAHPSFPVVQSALNNLADRSSTTPDATVEPQPGGGHYIMIDLGPGRTLKANKITFQINGIDPAGVEMTHARIYGFNKFGDTPDIIASSVPLPHNPGTWTNGDLLNTTGYRYFWIYGLDPAVPFTTPQVWPVLTLGEVELYGELTIVPAVELSYAFDGDDNGAFHYLGARGGGGTWRNPHTAGDIQVSLPYDSLEFGTLDSMVDREPSNTYLVNRDHSEIWFDLGADRSLLLSTLSFRQRADYGSSMTQTAIQGSVDGATWEEFQLFNVSGVASAWTKIDITAFSKYYRFFRLIIPVGKSFHSIGELELYGSLRLAAAGSPESPGFSVTGVQITNPGSNYRAAPRVIFNGGGGTGAAGTAVVEDGKVTGVTITAPGNGYTSAPGVEFSVGEGGGGATASATVIGGVVTALNVVAGGSGYTVPPKVKIVSSTGSGAAGTAVLTGDVVTSISLDSGGSGYARPPTVVLYPPTDPEADAEIGVDLDSITLDNGGSGYSSPPAVHIPGDGDTPATAVAVLGFGVDSVVIEDSSSDFTSDPGVVFGGDGSGAAGTAVRAFGVASTAVTAGGSGYLTEPEVQVDTGDAQFQALIGRALLRIDMAASGSGYTSTPGVVITGDGTTTATAHAVRSFAVASIAVGAGGTGYTVAPTVTIPLPTGANGRRATAHAVLTAGAVTSIVIDDPGQGYLTAPTPTMTGGDGTGATIGAATLATSGAIDSVVVDTAGANYSVAPAISFSGGGGTLAAASAILNTSAPGPIVKVKILNVGSNYTSAPHLTIAPGTSGGTGATATATLATTGKIKSVTMTTPGTGYTAPPPVTFTGGGGTSATAHAVLAPTGSVKSVTLVDPGDGFRSDARVTFTGGGGSGASATVVPSHCGHVTKVTLTKPGGPFTVPPDVIFVGGQSTECGSQVTEKIWLRATLGFPSGDVWTGGESGSFLLLYGDSGTTPRQFGTLSVRRGVNPTTHANAWVIGNGDTLGYETHLQNMYIDMAIAAGVAYNVEVLCELLPDNVIRIHPTVNGIEGTGKKYLYIGRAAGSSVRGDPMWEVLDELYIGSVEPGANILPVDVTFDNIAVGTDVGLSDIFSFGFDSPTFIPPFINSGSFNTSTVGAGGLRVQTHSYGSISPLLPGGFVAPPIVDATRPQMFRPTGILSATLANNNGGAHQTVVLDDGRVLATGGGTGTTRAEIYDPETELWTVVAPMPTARNGHCAVKLGSGKVIVFGGGSTASTPNYNCYIYDPVANTWTATGSMVASGADDPGVSSGGFPFGPAHDLNGTYCHAVVLDDGRIFCARGFREDNAIQIYDPAAGTWSVAARFELEWGASYGYITQRFTKLPNGKVLAAFGGWPQTLVSGIRQARYAIYDPGANTWTYALVNGGGIAYQTLHSQILLDDGRVLVAAGLPSTGPLKTLLYNYLTNTWDVRAPDYPTTWYGRVPIKYPDGLIALVGGQDISGPGRGYTVFNPATNGFTFHTDSLMAAERDHTIAELLGTGYILVIGGSSLATCDLLASMMTAATAAYRLGSSWPTLIEEQTDPTEGIIIRLVKDIVPARTPLPPGFSESFPLDIYRSIQIVSKVDLNSLPPPDSWDTTQHVQFPPLLLSIYPLWEVNKAQATAGGLATGTQRGSVSASVQVVGSIVITKSDGFRGAALATVERQFFFGPPPRNLVPMPTIIRPSTGTAITVTTRKSQSQSGLTYSANGQSNPAGNDFASYAKSSGSSGVTTQVVDLHDVLSAPIHESRSFSAANGSSADALNVQVGAGGTFTVDLPASTPFALVPGQTILAEVSVEKWRFGLYVRTIVRVTVPILP